MDQTRLLWAIDTGMSVNGGHVVTKIHLGVRDNVKQGTNEVDAWRIIEGYRYSYWCRGKVKG